MVEAVDVNGADRRAGPGRRSPRSTLIAAVFVVIAATLIALQVGSLAAVRPPGPDDSLYASEAARWLAGRPLTTMSAQPAAVRPPAYVLALAAATAATGDWQRAEPVVAAASVFAAVLAAAAIAWSLAGSVGAALSVAVFLVPGMAYAFSRSAIDGLQAAFVLVGVAVGMIVAGRLGGWSAWSAAAVGVFLGLAVLTKETALALAPWALLWAATQRASTLPASIRWGGIASGLLVLTVLPWWLWVRASVGTFFPTHIAGPLAVLGILAMAGIGVASVCLAADRLSGRVARTVRRFGPASRWWLAVAVTVIWAAGIVVAFLLSDARHAVTRLPQAEAILESTANLLGLLLVPWAAIPAGVVALALSARRPLLGGLMLVSLLTAGVVVIIGLKEWNPRSAIVPAVALGLLLPVAAGVAVRRLPGIAPPPRRWLATAALAAAVFATLGVNAIGLARAGQELAVPPESQRWNSPVVADAAAWLSERLAPGDTIVASWLFATSLDAMTDARYRIVETPTLQARIGRASEPILVPTGTLFRENARLPRLTPDDWIFVRRHPAEGYLVALSGSMLGQTISSSGARYVVLTGEHAAQSTATIAADVAAWPGVHEVARFTRADAEIVILEVDQGTFSVGPFATHLNGALVRDWPSIVRAGRRAVDPGLALCELLGGRTLEVFPDDERTQAIVAQRLPAGCPTPIETPAGPMSPSPAPPAPTPSKAS